MRRAVGKYARRYRFSHPTADDFFASMRDSLGPEAGDAVRTAFSEPSTIDLVAEDIDSWRRSDDKPGYIGHVLVRRRGTLRFPTDVLLIAEDGTTTLVRWDAQKAAALLPYEGETPLVAAVIDPQHRVHLDEDLTNNAVSSNGRTFPWRAFEGGSFVFGAFLRGIVP
ncbi:MAG: hypothetical protein IPK82_13735 [Polyangiaceae bacterium]|nr:hypothetical protein [Polyangiaceae bacterium]